MQPAGGFMHCGIRLGFSVLTAFIVQGCAMKTMDVDDVDTEVSTTAETILWYQRENHVAMVGRLIIKDLASELFDPAENLLGVTSFTDYTGLTLSNGMRITTRSDVTSDYANKTFFIEEVGSRISLVADTDMVTPEAFSSETGSIWDESGTEGFDTVGFDNTTGQVIKQDYYTINRASSDKNALSFIAFSYDSSTFNINGIRVSATNLPPNSPNLPLRSGKFFRLFAFILIII